MSAKKEAKESPPKRREKDPLQVSVSVTVRFGEEEDDRIILLDDREILMVGSIFRYRDKIARFLVTGLFKAAMLQPKVAARVLPNFIKQRS